MSDVGIIGSKNLIRMFTILGVEAHHAENVNEAKRALEKIVEMNSLKVLFILESLACQMREEIRSVQELNLFTVIPIPEHEGGVSYIDDELKRLSREAVGMEV